tara:strand:- start:127 stop:354 length:228 start_codon:yes stop_codon:yes gene_type:complete
MDDARKIKKVIGVLIHLSEHRGRSLVSGDLVKSEFFQKKCEELKNILTKNWDQINDLEFKFNKFQRTLENDRKKL